MLLDQHWYLLILDWMASELLILDSLATGNAARPELVDLGGALVGIAVEVFHLGEQDWKVVPEWVCSLGMI